MVKFSKYAQTVELDKIVHMVKENIVVKNVRINVNTGIQKEIVKRRWEQRACVEKINNLFIAKAIKIPTSTYNSSYTTPVAVIPPIFSSALSQHKLAPLQ